MSPHGPALFVPGNPETSAVWGPLLGELDRDDAVCLSLPGFSPPRAAPRQRSETPRAQITQEEICLLQRLINEVWTLRLPQSRLGARSL